MNEFLKEIGNGIVKVISWIKIVWDKLPEEIRPGISAIGIISIVIPIIKWLLPKRS